MDHKVRKAIVKDRREVSPGKGDQGVKPSRVCRHNEGKAAGKAKGKQFVAQPKGVAKKTSGYR
jgi:hypothetical protein